MTDQMRDAFNRLTAQGHMIGFSDFETGWEQCIAALGGDQLITMLDETRKQLIASMAKRERQRAALGRIANGEVLRDVSDGGFTALQALAEYQRFAREAIASAQQADHIGDVSEMVAAPVVPEGYRLQPLSEFDAMLNTRTVPDGWKLVPVVPTEEMLIASMRGVDYGTGVGLEHKKKLSSRQWKAMLAAALSRPGDEKEGRGYNCPGRGACKAQEGT